MRQRSVVILAVVVVVTAGACIGVPFYRKHQIEEQCLQNMRNLEGGLRLYCADFSESDDPYQGFTPPADAFGHPAEWIRWADYLEAYVNCLEGHDVYCGDPYHSFRCPVYPNTGEPRINYVMPDNVRGKRLGDLKKQRKVVFYEDEPRHDGKRTVGFADGTVKLMEYEPGH